MDMDISMDIHAKSVDMDMDIDGKFHIYGNPGDHIGRKSRKQTARTISRTPSLFGAQRAPTYSQGNMGKFWGE